MNVCGRVVYDPQKEFSKGENVVLIPNMPKKEDAIIKENYRKDSLFCSSSTDGFMRNLIYIPNKRILPIKNIEPQIASLLEPISIVINAIENFIQKSHQRREKIGVWGCGIIGYITTLLLKKYFPNAEITIVGKNIEKLAYFSFADHILTNNQLKENTYFDHTFECVGGLGTSSAIEQMIEHIEPQGCISLLGVSEENVPINTRSVLEKGLTILGDSRSGYEDFQKAVMLLQNKKIAQHIYNSISQTIEIKKIEDIHRAFSEDQNNYFKTVMRWEL